MSEDVVRDDLPVAKSIHESTMTIGGQVLVVHVLDTGERVIEAKSALRFIAALQDSQIADEEIAELISYLGRKGVDDA